MRYTSHAFSLFRTGVLRSFQLLLQSARGQKKSGKNQTEMAGSSGKLFMRVGKALRQKLNNDEEWRFDVKAVTVPRRQCSQGVGGRKLNNTRGK